MLAEEREGKNGRLSSFHSLFSNEKKTRLSNHFSFACKHIDPFGLLSTGPNVNLSTCPNVNLSPCPLVHLSICPLVYLFICPFVHLSTYPLVHLLAHSFSHPGHSHFNAKTYRVAKSFGCQQRLKSFNQTSF